MTDLKILIEAGLSMGSSVKNINDEIKALAKHPSLKSLNLKVDIDKSFIKSMNEFVAASKVLSTALEQQQKVISESVKTTKMLDGSIEKVTQKQLANGSIITQTTKKINEETKAYSEQKKTLQQLEKELDGYSLARTRANKNKLGEINSTTNKYKNQTGQQVSVNVDNEGNVKNYSQITDYLKQQQDALQKEQAINKQREQAAQQEYATRKALAEKSLKEEEQRNQQFVNQLKTRFAEEQKIARDRDALDKAHSAAITENLNRQKAVADMQAKITAAQARFKGNSSAVAELNALNAQLGNVSKVSNYKNALTELQTKLTQITSQAKLAGNETRTLGQRFGDAASKVAMWAGATSSVYMITRALRDMVSVVVQVDSQMTQLKRVMDESTDFEGMLSRSIQLANELGRSITEVNENAIGFARMGFDEDQTMNLAKTTTLLQNISELTPQESVDTLTAAMTIFNVEAGKSIEIANKLNEVDNNYAVTTQNLALSLTRAGASANTFGISMEKLIGDTAAITTATRESGSVVGNSLKSIYSRVTSMAKSEDVLKGVGVSMREMNGEVRDVSDILDDLAGKWNGLSKEQQQNTAVNLAGRYQLTRFLALMQNYDISVQATETALNSQGSATRENEKYMASLEARIQKMKTAWETMSLAFGDAIISDSIVTLTSLIASMLNGVAKVVDVVGALPVIFGVASVALLGLHLGFRMLIIEMTKTIASMFGLTIQTGTASAGLNRFSLSTIASKLSLMGLSGAANIAKVALRGLMIATGIGAAFAALGWAIEGIVGLFSDATQATEDFTDKTEALNEKQYDLANLKKLQEEYDSLSKKTSLNYDEKSKLAQIESELSSKYGITVQGIDGQTKSIQENNEAIKSAIELKEAELKIERDRAEIEYAANSRDIESNISKYKEQLIALEKSKQAAQEEYDLRTKILSQTSTSDPSYDANSRHAQNAAKALQEELSAYDETNTKLQEYTNKKALILKNAGQEYVDEQERNNVKISGMTRKFIDIYAQAAAESKIPADQIKNNIGQVFQGVQSGNIKNAEQGMKLLESLPGVANLTAESYRNMGAAISQVDYAPVVEGVENTEDAVDGLGDSANQTGQKVSEMSKKLDELSVWATNSKEEVELLNKAQSELAKKNTLSADTIKKMNEKYGDFIKITGLSKDSILKFIKAKKEEKTEFINAEIKKTEIAIEASMKRIAAVELEMSARQKLIDQMKEDYSDIAGQDPLEDIKTESRMGAVRSAGGKQADLTYEKEKLAELTATLQTWKSIGSDTKQMVENGDKAVQDATKSNDKSNQSYTDTNEILTETQKQFIKLADAIKKVQNERNTMVKGSKEYIASLEKEKKLTEDQIALAKKALKNPSELVSTKVKTTTTTSASDTTSDASSSTSSSNGSGTKLDTMLSAALGMQGQFKYQQIGGKFKGTFEEFKKRALADCSQFVQEFFEEFMDITLPRTAAQQSQQGTAVAKKDLKKGDLIFFETKKGYEASHVGIYTGNGKFIQMGTKSGLSEQSLDNSYWGPKYRSARRINGVGESTSASTPSVNTNTSVTKTATTSSDGKVKTEVVKATQKEIDDAVRDLELNLSAWTAEVYQQSLDIIDAYVTKTDNEITKLQSKRELSANKQSRYTQDSPEWRKEEMSQSSLLQQEQKLIEQQSKDIRKQLIDKKITQGEYDAKLAENSAKWWDYQSQIDDKRKSIFDSQIAAYETQVKANDDSLALSDANLNLLTEGTVEYNKELRSQIPLLENKSSVIAKEIAYVKSLLTNNKLNAELTAYYNDKLQELNLSLLGTNSALADVNKTLKDMRESAADNIIEEYKKVIEQQRDLALEVLDQEIKKENERHEERTKNIDDEQKQFENYINARLKAFDRENTSTDYTEELTKKMDERQKIQDRINVLSADTSMSGKAKRKELEEQLVAIDEEIRKYQRDRDRELVKQGLQDQLDDHKNYNDKIKDEEDKQHQDALDKLDDEKKKTERKYKDILEDQKYFYNLKQGLMSNDAIVVTATLGIIGGEYDKLFANMKTHIFETSKEMQNLLDQFELGRSGLDKFKSGDYSPTEPGSGGTSSGNGSTGQTGTIKGTTAARVAWTEYLSNKQSAESIKAEMSKLDKASSQYKNLTQQFDSLKSKNDQLRSVYGFPDGSFKDLVNQKIFSAETGGMTPAGIGKEGKFLLAHEKELVLNKSDTSNVLKIINVARDMFDRFKSGLSLNSISPKSNTESSSTDNSVRIENVTIVAKDTDTGQSLSDKFFGAVNKQLKTRMI
ncbi:phage tail tape measure protein [Paenibacillus sp. 1781tsa1]|uniref:phage tail tape measure protein n=1 Tax=Paenibacillus sp. 1781tsa1 TaxID=2953810 RepID=UPI00209F624D|nr:phage tail tape measure protein [Paenibacillus sp. 1781tsa1]MCP1185099.1 phage tail tape measure protein [Paenibacillus sp. 1781tsa1]